MDRSVRDDDGEPFFHLSSSSSSPTLARLDMPSDQPSSAHDVLAGYNFQSSLPRRRTFSVEQAHSRRHRSSGSPVQLTGGLLSARKDAEMDLYHSKTVSAVERTIKKHADNILRVLEQMNGRLSHLESVTQILEQSVASLKASVNDYHGEANTRLKAFNSNVMEMHRAVQILRDKQDIAETNAELAKLQASKAEAVVEVEKASASVPTTQQTVVGSSESGTQEHLALALVVPKRSSKVSSQNLTEISGQLHQLSLSGDVDTKRQYIVPSQTQIVQQPHLWSWSESRSISQPQVMIQSTPGVFQAESQHVQAPEISQPPPQGLFQSQVQHLQVQESVQYLPGVPEAQQYHGQQTQQIAQSQQHGQTQHIAHTQQGPVQQHVQAQHSVQVQQQATFQAQQQHAHTHQSPPAQEGIGQTLQYLPQTQQNAPYHHSAYQAQVQCGLPGESIDGPQGVFQAQSQHIHTHPSAQSQQVPYQAQQQQVQTQQNAQSQQTTAVQAQSQQVHSQAFRGPGQQMQPPPPPPPQPRMANQVVSYSGQPQFQAVPQQPLQPQYGSRSIQSLPTQIDHGAGGPHNMPYIPSSQQYPVSSQPIQRACDSNVYQYGPLPVQRAGPPTIPSVNSTRALPLAENLYRQGNLGEPSTHVSHNDGIVEKLGAMGYARADAWSAIKTLTDQGKKAVDVNAVLDFMNARSQSHGAWPQAR